MSLSDLASLGSFVSGFAVLVSLVFLYFQLRQLGAQINQAEKNQRAAIHQARQQARSDYASQWAHSNYFDVLARGAAGDPTLSETEAARYVSNELSNLFAYEEWYYQHLDGMIDERRWKSNLASLQFQLNAPGFRAAIGVIRPLFDGDFGTFLDELMAKSPWSGAGFAARWHDAVKAQS
jgi:hypothetical protein